MEQRLSLVTLGVSDIARSRAFYEAIGWRSNSPPELGVVFFQAGSIVFALWSNEELAADAGLPGPVPAGGVCLAHNVRTEAEVDQVVAEAEAAGATVTRPPEATFWGGYSGAFLDPDGHPWEIANNPGWEITGDGAIVLPG